MSFYDLLLIPILFGFIGFFEPCSLGANIIFLNRIREFSKVKRIMETTIFTLGIFYGSYRGKCCLYRKQIHNHPILPFHSPGHYLHPSRDCLDH